MRRCSRRSGGPCRSLRRQRQCRNERAGGRGCPGGGRRVSVPVTGSRGSSASSPAAGRSPSAARGSGTVPGTASLHAPSFNRRRCTTHAHDGRRSPPSSPRELFRCMRSALSSPSPHSPRDVTAALACAGPFVCPRRSGRVSDRVGLGVSAGSAWPSGHASAPRHKFVIAPCCSAKL